jgi:hypothetical protein
VMTLSKRLDRDAMSMLSAGDDVAESILPWRYRGDVSRSVM